MFSFSYKGDTLQRSLLSARSRSRSSTGCLVDESNGIKQRGRGSYPLFRLAWARQVHGAVADPLVQLWERRNVTSSARPAANIYDASGFIFAEKCRALRGKWKQERQQAKQRA